MWGGTLVTGVPPALKQDDIASFHVARFQHNFISREQSKYTTNMYWKLGLTLSVYLPYETNMNEYVRGFIVF